MALGLKLTGNVMQIYNHEQGLSVTKLLKDV